LQEKDDHVLVVYKFKERFVWFATTPENSAYTYSDTTTEEEYLEHLFENIHYGDEPLFEQRQNPSIFDPQKQGPPGALRP
jgi:hypothetical protein